MLAGILGFEWRYQTQRWTFAAVAAAFFGLGFVLAATGFGPPDVALDAPYAVAQSVGIASLLAVLAATLFAANAALRDDEHRVAEIVYATAMSERQYLIGRFVGALAALTAAFVLVLPGLWLGTYAVAHEASRVGGFALAPYLGALAILALPNLLLATAVAFAVALASRSALATYVGGVVLYFLYFGAALASGSPLMAGSAQPSEQVVFWAARLDPFGLSAFYATTRYWTVAERGVRAFDLTGALGVNRLLWLVLVGLLLAIVAHRFAFRLPRGTGRRGLERRGTARLRDGVDHAELPCAPLPRALPVGGIRAAVAGWRGLVGMELRHACTGWPLPALLVAWVAFVGIELTQTFRHREFGTAWLPATPLVLAEVTQPLALFGLLLVLVFAAELVWRERTAGMHEIVDATPIPSGVLVTAKLAALGALVLLFAGVAAATGMGFQLASGWNALEPGRSMAALAFVALPLLLVAVLVTLVQVVVPNRHLGLVVGVLVVLVWHLGAFGGPGHPLLRYAGLPEVGYSELAGFTPERTSYVGFALYWMAFAGLLVVVAMALWRRGTEPALGERGRRAWASRNGWRWLAAAAAVSWVGLGAVLHAELERTGGHRTAEEVEAWRADYERRYRHLETLPQPVAVDLEVAVDLFPQQLRATLTGRYRLENRTDTAIESIWIATRRDLARVELTVDGRTSEEADAGFGMHHFVLPQSLAPAATAELAFTFDLDRSGATAEAPRDLLANGSFLLGHLVLPSVGYRRSFELADPQARERQGLPSRQRDSAFGEGEGVEAEAMVPIGFAAVVSTTADQIAVAPGRLLATTERDGRRSFHYRAEAPISPVVAFASGRWVVERRERDGVAIEVLHHPGHGRNVEAMLDAAARTLDYGRRVLGPYPHAELRLVELPSTSALARRGTGFAVPGLVFLLEHSGFYTDRSDPARVDVVSKRVAHEVAHQWFGHQLSPQPAPGATALVESLARDTELRILAGLHGEGAVAPVLAHELDRYLAGRTAGVEPPLVAVEGESWLYYAKGALVMTALRDLVGDAAVERALGALFAAVRAGSQPNARDLVAALEHQAATEETVGAPIEAAVRVPNDSSMRAPVDARGLIVDWWNRVVLYDLAIRSAQATPVDGGRQRVELAIDARRIELRGEAEHPLPLDEELELAFYADDPGVAGGGDPPLLVERVRLGGPGRLVVEVDARARFVLLDPRILRIDRLRADNLRRIEARVVP
jgi:ABC-2 type transport system permease protein